MTLQDKLRAGRFVITAEVTPPVSADPNELLAKAAPLKGLADAVNVTDGAGARAHLGAVTAAAMLVEAGIEPVLQLTCRDSNRIALQSDLISAAACGVSNLLMLRGDDPSAGDQPDAVPVFDLDPRELLGGSGREGASRHLREGRHHDDRAQVEDPDRLRAQHACHAHPRWRLFHQARCAGRKSQPRQGDILRVADMWSGREL